MTFDPSRLYTHGPLANLLRRELAMLEPILGGIFGVWGLHIRPHRDAPAVLPSHLLSAVAEMSLAADGTMEGAARCEPQYLPFASESFKLVIAQHVLERTVATDLVAEEIARVLAPDGVALVFGFNPVSLWRPWLARRLPGDWRFQGANAWRDVLTQARLDVLQVRYSGLWSPRSANDERGSQEAPRWSRSLGRFCGSWLVLARKRRSALTPVRPVAARSELKVNPTLVPGARRECA